MEPTRNSRTTLVDLLDRVLDKGLIINADIMISVAGVPLIGINLRAAVAGMETMVRYGLMKDWDERSRAWESEHRRARQLPDSAESLTTYAEPGREKGVSLAEGLIANSTEIET